MSPRRAALEIVASLLTGAMTGAVLMLAWYGLEPTLALAHALLLYVYGDLPLSP